MADKLSSADLHQQILDRLEAEFGKTIADSFEASIAAIKTGAELQVLLRAVESEDVDGIMEALHFDPEAFAPLFDEIDTAFARGGDAAVLAMPKELVNETSGARLIVRFNVRNPRAETLLREQSSTLVTRITDDQREAIRTALQAGLARGDNPTKTALDLVGRIDPATGRRAGGIVGLTNAQAGFVQNARAELASTDESLLSKYLDRKLRDRRFDPSVAQAIKDGTPIPADVQSNMIVAYERRMLKLRGDMIGRTETLTALRSAKHEAYNQAVEKGLDPQTIVRTWRSAGDKHVRDTHEVLDGQSVVGMDALYESPSGALLAYPGDTSHGAGADEVVGCRCDEEYKIDFLAGLRAKSAADDLVGRFGTPE